MSLSRISALGAVCLVSCALGEAQLLRPTIAAVDGKSTSAANKGKSCNPFDLHFSTELTFRQRACFYEQRLTSRSMVFRAVASSAFGDFRNNPHSQDDGWSDMGHRVGVFYAQKTARYSGELIAGYLNHEDPRGHASHETGIWNRTRFALMSVLETTDQDGHSRPAFVPIAGAFGTGMVGVACYRTHNSLEDGFRRSGIAYGGYFGTALLQEFRPEIQGLKYRILHRIHN